MKCPKCGHRSTVYAKRILKNDKTRRYRKCSNCGYHFVTTEYYENNKLCGAIMDEVVE